MLNTKLVLHSSTSIAMAGVLEKLQKQAFFKLLECHLGDLPYPTAPSHCPIPLRDFLCKLHALVTFSAEEHQLHLKVPPEDALMVQILLTETGGSVEELFPPDVYEQVRPYGLMGLWDKQLTLL